MRFRCSQCKSPTEINVPLDSAETLIIPCASCGRKHRIAIRRPRQTTDASRYRKAKEFADIHQIDLASAYSVLEGILPLEEARASRGRSTPAQPGPARPPDPGGTTASGAVSQRYEEIDYDPAFAGAVRDGTLTPMQAKQRGERRAVALRLAQRHRLPVDLALKVADNRITLHQALAEKVARERSGMEQQRIHASHGPWKMMIFGIAALILLGLGVHLIQVVGNYLGTRGESILEPRAAEAASRTAGGGTSTLILALPPLTIPRTDATGQVVQVEGPDPRSVLIAFCGTGRRAGRREPIEIAPAVPQSGFMRFGVFRNLDQPSREPRAIRIHKDPQSGRWYAGDGRRPIATELPPDQPPGARTVSIVLEPAAYRPQGATDQQVVEQVPPGATVPPEDGPSEQSPPQ